MLCLALLPLEGIGNIFWFSMINSIFSFVPSGRISNLGTLTAVLNSPISEEIARFSPFNMLWFEYYTKLTTPANVFQRMWPSMVMHGINEMLSRHPLSNFLFVRILIHMVFNLIIMIEVVYSGYFYTMEEPLMEPYCLKLGYESVLMYLLIQFAAYLFRRYCLKEAGIFGIQMPSCCFYNDGTSKVSFVDFSVDSLKHQFWKFIGVEANPGPSQCEYRKQKETFLKGNLRFVADESFTTHKQHTRGKQSLEGVPLCSFKNFKKKIEVVESVKIPLKSSKILTIEEI